MGIEIRSYRKENENMGKLLLMNGQVATCENAVAASRLMVEVNGRKLSVCFEDVGFGPDTNTIRFEHSTVIKEIGNLTSEDVKRIMIALEENKVLDVSHIPVYDSLCNVDSGEYIYRDFNYNKRVSLGDYDELEKDCSFDEEYHEEIDYDTYDEDEGWGDIFAK